MFYDIKVDKHELLRALQYDRNQYEKGYADAKADAMDELVRCKDCKHFIKEEHGCNHHGYFYPVRVMDNDFCSYGERKDNGSNI